MSLAPSWGAIQVPKIEDKKMLIIMYTDWFGTQERLEERKKEFLKACKETEGIKSAKFYMPHQARYHYAWIIKADSYDSLMEAMQKMTPRDRNEETHASIEVFSEWIE